MSSNRILITGFNGQVGQSFASLSNHFLQYELVLVHHGELDITDPNHINGVLANGNFAAVINCAAYTSVDLAETEIEKASRINMYGPVLLAKKCNELHIPLIHFSSDYVYDNGYTRPLKEIDPCSPKSIYAITKLEGEQAALYYNLKTVILRTSWVYSEYGNNFLKTILKLTKENKEINVVNDQIGSPTYARDLAAVTLTILDHILNNANFNQYGIYNYANEGQISWFDFASEIVNISKSNCIVHPVSTVSFPRPAKRPAYSVFDLHKIISVFTIKPIPWQRSLEVCIKNLS
jgi:dTDP-4-dehydrorhamnose reductase